MSRFLIYTINIEIFQKLNKKNEEKIKVQLKMIKNYQSKKQEKYKEKNERKSRKSKKKNYLEIVQKKEPNIESIIEKK